MTKIIELAHLLGDEIAKSEEIRNLETAKNAFQSDEPLQKMMAEYDAERRALGAEFAESASTAAMIASSTVLPVIMIVLFTIFLLFV